MAKVVLDLETFKALASPTRLDVLRCIDERRKTLTEISRELGLNKATVHEHLGLLAGAELVKKHDEGRKWIYWELTWRGKRLLHPVETTGFSVMLGLSTLAAGGSVAMIGKALGWWGATRPLDSGGQSFPALGGQVNQTAPESQRADENPDADKGSSAGEEQAMSPPHDDAFEGVAADDAGEAAATGGDEPIIAGLLVLTTFMLWLLAGLLLRRVRTRGPTGPPPEADAQAGHPDAP